MSTSALTLVPLVTFIDCLLHLVMEAAVINIGSATGLSDASAASTVTGVNPVERCRADTDSAGNANENLEEPTNMYNIFQICVTMTCKRLQML